MKLRAISLTLILTACYGDVCEEFFDGNCPGNGGTGAAGATGGTGGVGADGGTGGNMGGTGGDGGTGGMMPGCELADGMEVGSDCGVFVGTTSGAGALGSKSNPYLNLPDALANLTASADIYVCNDFTETGSFTIPDGVRIFGKLSCGTYAYDPASTGPLFTSTPSNPVFRVEGDATLFGIRANATTATNMGANAIGVLVTGGTLELTESAVTVAAGSLGANGAAPVDAMAPSGAVGTVGTAGCDGSSATNLGGPGGPASACLVSTDAGDGGDGGNGLNNTEGTDGTTGGPNGTGGALGTKQTAGAPCGDGMSSGTVMHGGTGMAVAALGSLNAAAPYYQVPATEQADEGISGKGGGGGGGGKQCAPGSAGPGGGGGGAGGCGGLGGNSGASGGASLGVVLLGASELELTDSTVTAGGGGVGGGGALGQLGGSAGGPGGNGTGNANGVACDGGPGVDGGNGGPGAAGPGGPSAALVREFSAQMVTLNGMNDLNHGPSAAPGTPAPGGLAGSSGLTCMASEILTFETADCEL